MRTDALWLCLPSYLQICFCPLNCSEMTSTHPRWSTLFWQAGSAFPGTQPSGSVFSFFLPTFFFSFLSVISNRHPQQMLHASSLPCACCPICSCSSGMHIHHTGEHTCFSNTSHKASTNSLQHGIQHLWGALKQLPTDFFSVAFSDIALPEFTRLEFLLVQFLLKAQGENDVFTVASTEQHHFCA